MRRLISVLLSIALLLSLTAGAAAAPGAPRTVTVNVVGADGKPLHLAAVQVLTPGADRFEVTRTNVKGEAVIDLPSGFSFWIRTWADDHALVERPYVPATDGPVVTLTATRYNASLLGFVTDERGRPVAEAKVTVWLPNLGLQATAYTRADGRYQLDRLQVRDGYTLQVEARNFEPFVQADIALAGGARVQVDATLTPAYSPVTGEVLNSRTNQPANGVRAELILNGWGVVDRTTTDNFGYFRFSAPPQENEAYQVRLSGVGYETFTSAAFALTAGAWVNFTGENRVALNPLFAELSGSVLDQYGSPLSATPVELQRTGLGTVETAETDKDGFFLFTNVPAGTYRVRAVPTGGQEHGASDWVTVQGGDRAAADVSANTPDTESFGASAIVGTVRDHLGNPVSGATVTAARGSAKVTAVTDAQGRYRVGVESNVDPALEDPEDSSGYRVFVAKDGYIPTDLQEVADGTPPPAMVDVRQKSTNRANFTLQPSTATVAGRVLTDRGLPLTGVAVSLMPEGGGTALRATTDAAGRYVFANLPVAKQVRYLPVVTADQYLESSIAPDGGLIAPANLNPGGVLTHSLTVRPRQVEVRGEAHAGTDLPASGATVTLISPADGKAYNAQVAENGSYTVQVPAVPGRQYLVRADMTGATVGTTPAAIDPGADYGAVANVTLAPTATITGRVYTPDGKPAPKADVTLWMEGHKEVASAATADENGYYTFTNLVPGRRYSVTVWWAMNTWSTLAPGEAIITPLLSPGPGTTMRADLQAPAAKSAK